MRSIFFSSKKLHAGKKNRAKAKNRAIGNLHPEPVIVKDEGQLFAKLLLKKLGIEKDSIPTIHEYRNEQEAQGVHAFSLG